MERLKLVSQIRDSKFLAVMSDGSTDKSVTEQEIVYVRMANKGLVQEHFVSIESVEKADAGSVLAAIETSMVHAAGQPDWKSKLVAIGTDGASVNTGKNTGVVKRLRDEVPHLVGVHCMAHRLELPLNDAAKTVPPQKATNKLLLSLYLFYHASPFNRSNLKNSCKSLDMGVSCSYQGWWNPLGCPHSQGPDSPHQRVSSPSTAPPTGSYLNYIETAVPCLFNHNLVLLRLYL